MPSSLPSRPGGLLREPGPWLLVLLGVAFFGRQLFGGETFFYRDLFAYFLPQKRLLVDLVARGEVPLWDPYLHGGQAYLTNIANFALYPANLLYAVLPLLRAFNATIALHVVAASLAAYACARSLGLGRAAGFLVGSLYGYCGATLSLVNLLNLLLAMPYIPLGVLAWDRFLRTGRRRWFVLSLGTGVLQILPGAPEANALTLLLLLGWGLWLPGCRLRPGRALGLWALLVLLLAGLSAVVLWPAAELSSRSARSGGMDYEMFSAWSLTPARLPELVIPEFFGSHGRSLRPEVDYWGSRLMEERAPTISSVYLGGVGILLAVLGGLGAGPSTLVGRARGSPEPQTRSANEWLEDSEGLPGRGGTLDPRTRRFLLLFAAGCLILSLGRALPFFRLLFEFAPLISSFRFPVKAILGAAFPLALLAGCGLELLLAPAGGGPAPRPLLLALRLGAVLLGALAASFTLVDGAGVRLVEAYFGAGDAAAIVAGLRRSVAHAFLIWVAAALVIHGSRRMAPSRIAWLLAALVSLDVVAAGRRVNPSRPDAYFQDVPPVVAAVGAEIGDGRLFRDVGPRRPTLYAPADDIVWYYRWQLETLDGELGAFFRIPIIFHEDLVKLAPSWTVALSEAARSLPWERRLGILSAGGVTAILSPALPALDGIRPAGAIPNRSDMVLLLGRNERALPPAQVLTRARLVESDAEALAVLSAPGHDPRAVVVLHAAGEGAAAPGAARYDGACDASAARVSLSRAAAHHVTYRVETPCDGLLVLTEPYDPGWQTRVEGRRAEAVRANLAFSAVPLAAGEHRVERRYRPASLLSGGWISLLAAAGLTVLLGRWPGRASTGSRPSPATRGGRTGAPDRPPPREGPAPRAGAASCSRRT